MALVIQLLCIALRWVSNLFTLFQNYTYFVHVHMRRSAHILNLRIIGLIGEYCWCFCGEIRDNQGTRAMHEIQRNWSSVLVYLYIRTDSKEATIQLITRNSVHYSCPRFWYPVYWMCIDYKDCVYNCWEINVWSLLLTFKCCKVLLEDEGDKGCKYRRPPCALAKVLPETTVRA